MLQKGNARPRRGCSHCLPKLNALVACALCAAPPLGSERRRARLLALFLLALGRQERAYYYYQRQDQRQCRDGTANFIAGRVRTSCRRRATQTPEKTDRVRECSHDDESTTALACWGVEHRVVSRIRIRPDG